MLFCPLVAVVLLFELFARSFGVIILTLELRVINEREVFETRSTKIGK